jgi:predicted CXXCH cytochrome family protein
MAEKQQNIALILNSSLCGSCHNAGGNISSNHHPTYDEWAISGHNSSGLPSYVKSNANCSGCHDAWNAIQHLETGTLRTEFRLAGEDAPLTWEISCVVCHDPHSLGTANTQLRLPVDQLCQKCHTQEDAEPGQAVHHPQAEVRNNTAGYLVDRTGLTYMDGMACSECHMPINAAGLPNHTFDPNPWSCVTCHGAPDYPDNASALAYIGMIRSRTVENVTAIQPLVDQAEALVQQMSGNRSGVLSAYRNEFNISLFNIDTVIGDKSNGNHNPELVAALLNDSRARAISAIENLTPPDKITGVTVVAGEDGVSIVITWTASSAADFAKYRLYVLSTSKTDIINDTWSLEVTDKATVTANVTGLSEGTYYVYVTAVDADGNEITNTLAGTSVVLEEEEEPEDEGWLTSEVLAGIAILAAIVVIVAAVLMMRKRKGSGPAETETKKE